MSLYNIFHLYTFLWLIYKCFFLTQKNIHHEHGKKKWAQIHQKSSNNGRYKKYQPFNSHHLFVTLPVCPLPNIHTIITIPSNSSHFMDLIWLLYNHGWKGTILWARLYHKRRISLELSFYWKYLQLGSWQSQIKVFFISFQNSILIMPIASFWSINSRFYDNVRSFYITFCNTLIHLTVQWKYMQQRAKTLIA